MYTCFRFTGFLLSREFFVKFDIYSLFFAKTLRPSTLLSVSRVFNLQHRTLRPAELRANDFYFAPDKVSNKAIARDFVARLFPLK